MSFAYTPQSRPDSRLLALRQLRYHVLAWNAAATPTADLPPLVLLHGWMDVGASFQFMVDALRADRTVFAPDWRGFGRSGGAPVDTYWFPDYLADLDALLDAVAPDGAVDLVGHSMGGNVAMLYAGVRPERVRRLAVLEGFGMPASVPAMAPARLRQWLDEGRTPPRLQSYATLDELTARLYGSNPRLAPERAAWLAAQWSEQRADGRWHLCADPAHKRVNPVLYQVPEVLETWKRITAPMLWVDGDLTDVARWWGHRYPRSEFDARLAVVPQVERHTLSPAGHMLHHDQPEALAALLERFLAGEGGASR